MRLVMEKTSYPIFINSSTSEMMYPNYKYFFILMESGETIELHCPGVGGLYIGKQHYGWDKLELKCLYDWGFEGRGTQIDIRTVKCVDHVDSVAR